MSFWLIRIKSQYAIFQTQRYWGYLKVIKYILCIFKHHPNLISTIQEQILQEDFEVQTVYLMIS